jgi:ARP2/3 complex 20 kDa subunit (ARPC4)
MEEVDKEISEMKLSLNSRARIVAESYLIQVCLLARVIWMVQACLPPLFLAISLAERLHPCFRTRYMYIVSTTYSLARHQKGPTSARCSVLRTRLSAQATPPSNRIICVNTAAKANHELSLGSESGRDEKMIRKPLALARICLNAFKTGGGWERRAQQITHDFVEKGTTVILITPTEKVLPKRYFVNWTSP